MISKLYLNFILSFFLFSVFTSLPVFGAEKSDDNATQEKKSHRYSMTFISLKPSHSIRDASCVLSDNGTFEFKIANEELAYTSGSFNLDRAFFESTAKFTIKSDKEYHYELSLKGISIAEMYVFGVATLCEFIEDDRLTQKLTFLFLASSETKDKTIGNLPFFKRR